MDKPRVIFGEGLRVGTRSGHASRGVTAARGGEAVPPVLLP